MSRELLEAVLANDEASESKVAELLKNPDIDVNLQFENKSVLIKTATALHAAALKGATNKIKLLLAHPKIDPNALTGFGGTALQLAVDTRQVEACKLLLPVTNLLLDEKGKFPYFLAKDRVRTTKSLEEKGRAETIVELLRVPTFVTACASGKLSLVKRMVEEEGADINAFYGDGFGLYYASLNGRIEVVDYLLTRPEIKINQRTPIGLTLLNEISAPYNIRKILSQLKPDENKLDYPMPLIMPFDPAYLAREIILKKLIAHGADVNLTDVGNIIDPLLAATYNNALNMVKILVQEGKVDPGKKYEDPDTKEVFDIILATRRYRPEISEYLQQAKRVREVTTPAEAKKLLTELFKHRYNSEELSISQFDQPGPGLKVTC